MPEIHSTAVVSAGAQIGEDAEVGPYCVVGPEAEIGRGTRLMSHVVVDGKTAIGEKCMIFPFASLGTMTQDLKYKGGNTYVRIGDRTTVREYVTINSATNDGEMTEVGNDCHIMAYAHIAHACKVGSNVIMSNCATLAGHVEVEDYAILGGLTGVHQFVRIGSMAMLGGCTKASQDCPPYMIVDGHPARVVGPNKTAFKRRGMDTEAQNQLKAAFKMLYREGLSTSQALEKIRSGNDLAFETRHLVDFVENSKRGIIK